MNHWINITIILSEKIINTLWNIQVSERKYYQWVIRAENITNELSETN